MAAFLNPLLWPLLGLAAVPLVLHLLSLRRLPTIELATFRFLFDTYVQQRRKMRLQEILIAILRVLFVLLLVLAAMRPALQAAGGFFGLGGGRPAVIVLDCSASMGLATAGVSSLDRAKEAAVALLGQLSPADRVSVVRLDGKAEPVVQRFAADSPEVAEAVRRQEVGIGAGGVLPALTAALAADKSPGRAVFVFTDLQKSGFKELADGPGQRLLPPGDKLTFVNVGAPEPVANVAVVGDAPRDAQTVVGQPVELKARVSNAGAQPAEVALRVEVDGAEVARLPVSVPPGKATERTVSYVPSKPGVLRGRFLLDRDRFEADDTFGFCVNVAPPLRVLLVNGKPNGDPFQDELVFLRAALQSQDVSDEALAEPATIVKEPGKGADAAPRLRVLGASSLQIEEVRDGEWDADRLAGVAAVVLANAHQIQGDKAKDLRAFVDGGGGLLVFPGDHLRPDNVRDLLTPEGVNLPPLVGVQFENSRGNENDRTKFERLTALDYRHPVLAVFEPAGGQAFLTAPKFFKWHPLRVIPKTGTVPLAQLGNGDPALVEARLGRGRVLLAAFPVSSAWSTLPLQPDFVPLMLRMVSYVRRPAPLLVPGAAAPRAAVPVQVSDRLDDPQATVTLADGGRKALTLAAGATSRAALIGEDDTAKAGTYVVELVGEEAAARDFQRERERPRDQVRPQRRISEQMGFVVNPASAEEHDFRPATPAEVGELLAGDVQVLDVRQTAAGLTEELTTRREVWRPLVLLMVAVFVAEFFLATLRGPATAAEREERARRGGWLARLTGVKAMPADPAAG